MAKEIVRCTLRLSGAELAQVREVQDLLSLNAEVDACRYLMQRGVEALSSQLGARRLLKRAEGAWAPSEILPLLQAMEAGGVSKIQLADKTP